MYKYPALRTLRLSEAEDRALQHLCDLTGRKPGTIIRRLLSGHLSTIAEGLTGGKEHRTEKDNSSAENCGGQ